MSQTPTNDNPIFDQLVSEFAAKGATYDEFIKWTTPAFVWDSSRPVIQLDKQRRGVNIAKDPSAVLPPLSESSQRMVDQVKQADNGTFGMGLPMAKVEPLYARVLPGQVHSDVLKANGIELPPYVTGINPEPGLIEQYVKSEEDAVAGQLLQDYIAQVGEEFAAQHPLAVVTDMHTEMNADGSATVVFEAVQPITSVMPLSEKNTAKPME